LGLLTPAVPGALTETQYQLEKYLKHTAPASAYNFNSVFTGPGSEMYQQYIVTTVASGHVQVDDQSRTNVVWVASDQTGISYSGGTFAGPNNAVKVVFHEIKSMDSRFTSELKAANAGFATTCPVLGYGS
jgi:hypothetical protein